MVTVDWGQGFFGRSEIEGSGRQLQSRKGDKLALPLLLGLKVVGDIAPQKMKPGIKVLPHFAAPLKFLLGRHRQQRRVRKVSRPLLMT